MAEITTNVNWVAVIVGAGVAFVLGWLWYSPVAFGTKWAEGVGVKAGSAGGMPVAPMVLQAVGLLLLAWFVGVTASNNALLTLILVVVAFAVLMAAGGLFAQKSQYSVGTEVGYFIAAAFVMFLAQAIF